MKKRRQALGNPGTSSVTSASSILLLLSRPGDALLAIDLGTGRTATAIAVGSRNTCALLDDATVKCWGINSSGQLGQGDTSWRGDEVDEMGDFLLPVELGTGYATQSLRGGGPHACALLIDGAVKCWGANTYGSLGQGDTNHRGDEPGEMGDALWPIDLGLTPVP